ncbi:hypothetical protein RclHR1_03130013 [Rhizophagus clarus]|uniref:Uncharacterized protein n=1 Tax=Rhizophagus clarus TaxID=94130 RepID=A0A2Z6RAM2_9GLOM|nr:hypothetical protein RclHR1_03130009 [Rhizophagus clarus]GBB98072.1 hypothetical protein RclHR1_03130013 [Rhizophagus clarus]GES81824.1 hypothetical protein GLOIN_2v1721362 [Rhizophagus clarus]
MPADNTEDRITCKRYSIPLGIAFFLLAIISLIQGIIAITFGSLFHSYSLSTFGISSVGQIIIVYYIYHQLVTEHLARKISSTPTETTPILNNTRNIINNRRATEKKIAITGMSIYLFLAAITLFTVFYINKKMDEKDPNNPSNPPSDGDRNRPPIQILLFSIYAIHPFFILIPLAWYLTHSSNSPSPAWRNATIWSLLLFLMAYTQFINSQLFYFVTWGTTEIVCTLIMVSLFLIYSIRLFILYVWKGGNYENIVP